MQILGQIMQIILPIFAIICLICLICLICIICIICHLHAKLRPLFRGTWIVNRLGDYKLVNPAGALIRTLTENCPSSRITCNRLKLSCWAWFAWFAFCVCMCLKGLTGDSLAGGPTHIWFIGLHMQIYYPSFFSQLSPQSGCITGLLCKLHFVIVWVVGRESR